MRENGNGSGVSDNIGRRKETQNYRIEGKYSLLCFINQKVRTQ